MSLIGQLDAVSVQKVLTMTEWVVCAESNGPQRMTTEWLGSSGFSTDSTMMYFLA